MNACDTCLHAGVWVCVHTCVHVCAHIFECWGGGGQKKTESGLPVLDSDIQDVLWTVLIFILRKQSMFIPRGNYSKLFSLHINTKYSFPTF